MKGTRVRKGSLLVVVLTGVVWGSGWPDPAQGMTEPLAIRTSSFRSASIPLSFDVSELATPRGARGHGLRMAKGQAEEAYHPYEGESPENIRAHEEALKAKRPVKQGPTVSPGQTESTGGPTIPQTTDEAPTLPAPSRESGKDTPIFEIP